MSVRDACPSSWELLINRFQRPFGLIIAMRPGGSSLVACWRLTVSANLLSKKKKNPPVNPGLYTLFWEYAQTGTSCCCNVSLQLEVSMSWHMRRSRLHPFRCARVSPIIISDLGKALPLWNYCFWGYNDIWCFTTTLVVMMNFGPGTQMLI